MHKLLLADDSVTIQRVIELTFSGEDIHVVAVNDGEQAIARIPSERPDIVLADIGMPKKGGYDVAAFVKGRGDLEHIPVLLLAGAFEPVDQARAEQVRCDGVLIKPFEPRQVIERVRELLDSMKGSAVHAVADVPRRAELPMPELETPLLAAAPVAALPAAAPAPVNEPAPLIESDSSLDDYFESLNAVFESVGPGSQPAAFVDTKPVLDPPPAAEPIESHVVPSAPDAPRRRGDALDDYFERLSNAFEQAKPADVPHASDGDHDEPVEELIGERHVPTVDALVASVAPATRSDHGTVNGNGNSTAPARNGHARPRNPIVDALEALLGQPEAAPSQQTLPSLPDAHVTGNGALPASDLADTVTERVLDRLLPEITATVRRLVQEEVDRIRQH